MSKPKQFNWPANFETAVEVERPYGCEIRGEVPDWLDVTVLRNGPGRFRFGTEELHHWFDGMAYVQRFEFHNGGMKYSGRFLQSEGYKRCEAAQRVIVSQFGTNSFMDPCKNIFDR